jgi:hypothetical protein
MSRIKRSLAAVGTLGILLAVPTATSANTSGTPTAPGGTNLNRQTTVCHHNFPPDGAVTVTNRHGTIENGSGDSVCAF